MNNPSASRFSLIDNLRHKTLLEKFRVFLRFKINHWRYFESIFCVTILVDNVPTRVILEDDMLCLYKL